MILGVAGGVCIFCITCWISIQFKISRLVISMAMGTAVSGLANIIANGKYEEIVAKYLGEDTAAASVAAFGAEEVSEEEPAEEEAAAEEPAEEPVEEAAAEDAAAEDAAE
jgi:ribose/xylose/arabinose/galactoside ABC-type transport system permease subunit